MNNYCFSKKQKEIESKLAAVDGFVGWEYSRTAEWSRNILLFYLSRELDLLRRSVQ